MFTVANVNFPMLADVFLLRMDSDNIHRRVSMAVMASKSGNIDVVEAFKQFRASQQSWGYR